jgi:hypothetical protein
MTRLTNLNQPGNRGSLHTRQQGLTTLFVSLVLLIGVTLITVHSSKLSVLELIISSSYEDRHIAFNMAESGADAVYANIESIVNLNKPVGYKNCTTHDSKVSDDDACDVNNITVEVDWPESFNSANHQASLVFERRGCAPRSMGTSCDHVKFAHYKVTSVYDDTDNDRGRSQVVMGLMELAPSF